MSLQFTKATKERAKLRLALFGPSGSGKTYTALRLATGLTGDIAVIDTERGSASKYADRFTFDVLDLPATDINTYCAAIAAAAEYDVLVIDSLTHAWHELLQEVERLAKAKYSGNTWSAWSEGTPRQRQLVDALLDFDGHLIATMRTKTEWAMEKDNRGRNKPVRIGLAPEQGKGIEYEFDVLMQLSPDHVATVIKDRTGRFQDRIVDCPSEDLGAELAEWLQDGAPAKPKPPSEPEQPAPEAITPPPNGKTWTQADRPYPPHVIAKGLRAAADKQGNGPSSEKQQLAVRLALEALFPDDAEAPNKRRTVTQYVFDAESSKSLTSGQCGAILDWARIAEEGDDGQTYYSATEHAPAEAASIVNAVCEAAGQQKLEGV